MKIFMTALPGGQAELYWRKRKPWVNGQAAYVISSELSGSDLEDFMSESFSGTDEMMGVRTVLTGGKELRRSRFLSTKNPDCLPEYRWTAGTSAGR